MNRSSPACNPEDAARQAGKDAAREAWARAKTVEHPSFVLLTSCAAHEEQVLEGISEVLGDVPVIGGSAADDNMEGKQWVMSAFANQPSSVLEYISSGVSLALMWPSAKIEMIFSSCYNPTAASGKVTKVNGRVIEEIDGKPAAQVYAEWTGNAEIHKMLELKERPQQILPVTTLQPIGRQIVAGGSHLRQFNALLHPSEITEGDGLACFAGGLSTDDVLFGMRATKQDLVSSIKVVLKDQLQASSNIQGALVVYCGGCAMQIKNELPQVAQSFSESIKQRPFLGLFTFGEQGIDPWDQNRHGNLMFSCLLFRQ